MADKTQVLIVVTLPDELCGEYLQHIRDFDREYPQLQFGISVRKDGEIIEPPVLPTSISH